MEKSTFTHVFCGKEYSCELLKVPDSKSVALFLPGISGNPFDPRFDFIADVCVESGASFFRFNCWNSAKEISKLTLSELLLIVSDALFFLSELGFKKIFLVGKSFGGELSLLSANHLVSGLILIAPAVGVSSKSNVAEFSKKKLSEINACLDIKVDKAFLWSITVPVLIIHSSIDPSVPLENSQKIVSLMRHAEVFVVEEADHSFREKNAQAFAALKMKEFFEKFLLI